MSAQLEEKLGYDNEPPLRSFAEMWHDLIDVPNAEYESRQLSEITNVSLSHHGQKFDVTTFMPSKLRTWVDNNGTKVQYPELLMAHGVASDQRYFWELFKNLNKLGIACSAIELPREHSLVTNGQELLHHQSGAMLTAHEFLQNHHDNQHIVLGGQSRGTVVASIAAGELVTKQGPEAISGLYLLAPSFLPKSLPEVAINLAGLGINSFRHSRDIRLLGQHIMMISEIIAANPEQTVLEVWQALRTDVTKILYETLAEVSIFIPAAENDEFVDHLKIVQLARNAPAGNISVITQPTNHMFGQSKAITTYTDPATLEGQTLGWLQSRTPNFSPTAVDSTGNVHRLAS